MMGSGARAHQRHPGSLVIKHQALARRERRRLEDIINLVSEIHISGCLARVASGERTGSEGGGLDAVGRRTAETS